jgi:hypothetical protein
MELKMSSYRDKITRQKQTGYFRTADFEQVKELVLTIDHLDQDEMVFDKQQDVLHFVEDGRQLTLNVTNAETLMDLLGDEPAQWPGRQIVLFLTTYEKRNGELAPCIRIRAPGSTVVALKTTSSIAPAPDLDDEIPF